MVYSYYDTPDGDDCFKKMLCAAKFSGFLGLFTSALDVLMYSHPKGYGATVARFGYYTIPFVGVGTVFAATTCLSTNIRKKDDRINYLIGGAVSGSLVGVWQKSYHIAALAAIVGGVAAVIKKDSLIDGWQFFPEMKTYGFGDFRSIKRDFSLLEEQPRQWKAAGED